MSVSLALPKPSAGMFEMKSISGKQMKWIAPRPAEDAVLMGSVRVIGKTKTEVEALVVSETQHKALPVDYLMSLRGPFIARRDAILDNPLRYFNPLYRKELREIDSKLDAIDIMIHALESQGSVKESDLNAVIMKAEERLTECFKLLSKK